jgi:hypothetical protein
MTQTKAFWQALMLGVLVFYGYALMQGLSGGLMQRPVLVALAFLVAHTLEIPVAFRKLRDREPDPTRVVLATLVFGLTWWIPASRGLFAVK